MRPLCFVRYNNRDDNLGDVLIFQAFLSALKRWADVYRTSSISRRKRLLMIALRWVTRQRVISFGSLGARISSSSLSRPASFLERILGVRSVYLGFSVIPGTTHPDLADADFIGVRDNDSLLTLRKQGFCQAQLFPDAMFLAPLVDDASQTKRTKLLVSFRARVPDNGRDPRYEEALLCVVPEVVNRIAAQHHLTPEFYYQVIEDKDFNVRLATACHESGAIFMEELLVADPNQICSHYLSAAATLSNRLHRLLLGAIHGSVPLALTDVNHSKVRSLFETIGWDQLVLNIHQEPAVAACRLLNDSPSHRNQVLLTHQQLHNDGHRQLRSLLF